MDLRSFLRLFPAFRALEAEAKALREDHARLTTENLVLNDRLDAAGADRNKLWETMLDCQRGERAAYQMHVNQSWQKMGAGTPYPDAPHMQASAVPKEQSREPIGRRGRMLPSEIVEQQRSEFIQNLVGKG
jgi:hypothetical protein